MSSPSKPHRPSRVEIIGTDPLHRGYSRLDRHLLRHERYAGGLSPVIRREILDHGVAVAVLLFDPDADALVMIEQFRAGAYLARWDPWLLEIVAGMVEEGESPEEVCRREVREEAGLEIGPLFPVQRWLASPGIMTETLDLWCGRVDSTQAGGLHGLSEEGEDIRVIALPLAEARAMLDEGRLSNATAIIALQWLFLNLETARTRLCQPLPPCQDSSP